MVPLASPATVASPVEAVEAGEAGEAGADVETTMIPFGDAAGTPAAGTPTAAIMAAVATAAVAVVARIRGAGARCMAVPFIGSAHGAGRTIGVGPTDRFRPSTVPGRASLRRLRPQAHEAPARSDPCDSGRSLA
jgi:hypothetical protein